VNITENELKGPRNARNFELRWQSAVAIWKLDRGCIDCGYNTDPAALEFDHVRGEKRAPVSIMIRRHHPQALILEELEKCDVRCANCHRIVTMDRLWGWA